MKVTEGREKETTVQVSKGEQNQEYVSLGDVCRNSLNMQCQYGSRYAHGKIVGYPNLGIGLRFQNLEDGDYHRITIHKQDVDEFVSRVLKHKKHNFGWRFES